MLVKICGVSNAIDARVAVQSGADAIGFVMGGRVLPSEVEPHAQTVREIIGAFPKHVDGYLVTHLYDAEDILALSDYIRSSGIQVSEDVGIETMKALRFRTSKKIIKTIVVDATTALQKMKECEPYCDFILLDSRVGGYVGGTGATNDWDVCGTLIDSAAKPVYLAGGLTPENLLAAVRTTHPFGVDVSTGVSTYSDAYLQKDRKDPEKIKKFITRAKNFRS